VDFYYHDILTLFILLGKFINYLMLTFLVRKTSKLGNTVLILFTIGFCLPFVEI